MECSEDKLIWRSVQLSSTFPCINGFPCYFFWGGNKMTSLIILLLACLHTCYSPQAYIRMPPESSSRAPEEASLPSTRAGRKCTARPGHLQDRHASALLKTCGVTQALLHLNVCYQVYFFYSSHLQAFSPRNYKYLLVRHFHVFWRAGKWVVGWMKIYKVCVCVCWGGSKGDSNKRAIISPHFKSTGIY